MRISKLKCAALAVLACWAVLAAGCGGAQPHIYAEQASRWEGVARVAVIPFANNTSAPEAGNIVTGAFIAGLVRSGRFRVEFPGTVRSFFIRERLVIRTGVDLKTLAMMRIRLGVDAVVLGQVEEYAGSEEIRRAVEPRATVSIRVVDAATGRIMFMARHGRTGEDYAAVLGLGRVRTVGGLSRRVVDEIVESIPAVGGIPAGAEEERG